MSHPTDDVLTELHLFSPVHEAQHIELLTAIDHYHHTGAAICLGDTVNFGRPWFPGSRCNYGLISLPYLDGPALEVLDMHDLGLSVHCLWLVPVSKDEVEYMKRYGRDALESKLEEQRFNYLDPGRRSVV
jgi:hypothetical protein